MTPLVAGWLAIGVPLLVLGFYFLNRQRPVMYMFFGACLLGMGYLTATGAVTDIGAKLLGNAKGVATSPTSPAAPGPSMAPPAPSEYPTK